MIYVTPESLGMGIAKVVGNVAEQLGAEVRDRSCSFGGQWEKVGLPSAILWNIRTIVAQYASASSTAQSAGAVRYVRLIGRVEK